MPCHLVLQLSSSKHLKTNKNNKKNSSHAQVIPENNNKKNSQLILYSWNILDSKTRKWPYKNKETNKKYMLISLRSIDKKVSREIEDLKKQDLN